MKPAHDFRIERTLLSVQGDVAVVRLIIAVCRSWGRALYRLRVILLAGRYNAPKLYVQLSNLSFSQARAGYQASLTLSTGLRTCNLAHTAVSDQMYLGIVLSPASSREGLLDVKHGTTKLVAPGMDGKVHDFLLYSRSGLRILDLSRMAHERVRVAEAV